MASTRIYRELRKRNIPAELHLFADRGHTFMGDSKAGIDGTAYDYWLDRMEEYLCQMEFTAKTAPAEKMLVRFPSNDDRADYCKEDIWPTGMIPEPSPEQCPTFIEWHTPKELKTKAIQIVYSGGAYRGNGVNGEEVAPVRRYFNSLGMTVVTLQYRTPTAKGLAKHTSAWQDLQRAIRVVRSQATERGLDPNRIGIMGFFAGGHLTLMGATSSRSKTYEPIDKIDELPCNVQWAAAIYPAYVLTDGVNGVNKHGGNTDEARLVEDFVFERALCPP